ncbi:MAG: hypothetical protein ACO1OB_23790 [Archangium sp.]
MSSFIQFGASMFLAMPLLIAGMFWLRREELPIAAAPVFLFPVTLVAAWVVWHDDGTLGLIGTFGMVFWIIAPARGLFDLLKGLKQRGATTTIKLVDERERR